jgi:hypothetical protein
MKNNPSPVTDEEATVKPDLGIEPTKEKIGIEARTAEIEAMIISAVAGRESLFLANSREFTAALSPLSGAGEA